MYRQHITRHTMMAMPMMVENNLLCSIELILVVGGFTPFQKSVNLLCGGLYKQQGQEPRSEILCALVLKE